MLSYLDITTSYYNESLTIFIGTGFSKWITNNKVPSWNDLLVYCTDKINSDLKDILFFKNTKGDYIVGDISLPIVAQILDNEAKKYKLKLKDIVCDYIKSTTIENNIDKNKVELFQSMFNDNKQLNIITTNYDTILSDYIFPSKCRVFTDIDVFSKSQSIANIFHIHGIVNDPYRLILTQKDYYNFQLKSNYFSRKLYTLIHETSIVLLGTSLNDYNINFILNEANSKKNKIHNNNDSDILYVTKDKIDNILKEFHKLTYDIEVFDVTTFEDFIENFNKNKKDAIKTVNNFSLIKTKIINGEQFDDDFILTKTSFYQILMHLKINGDCISDTEYFNILLDVLNKKMDLCKADGAWIQYDHLSNWLVELLSLFDFKTSHINKIKDIILFSLKKCSKTKYIGYSWDAYQNWDSKWHKILPKNQSFLTELINNEFKDNDSYGIRLLIERKRGWL